MTDTPPERDCKDFKFKQLAKIRVQAAPQKPQNGRVKHLAVATRYGLVFAVVQNGFKVLRSNDIVSRGLQLGKAVTQTVQDFDFWTSVDLQQCPQDIGVSCDGYTLAVCVKKSGFPFAYMYDVRAFANKGQVPAPFLQVKLSSAPNVELLDTAWNPGAEYPSLYAVCMSDGSMTLFDIKNNLEVLASLPGAANVTCICWSPKGKQLVAGKKDGSLTQYDQKLTEKKQIPGAPNVFNSQPVMVTDVLWESTFVFFAAYTPVNNTTHEQPHVVQIVNPKGGSPHYIDLEDVCYGGGEERQHRVYMSMLAEWKMIVATSSTSLESAAMGKNPQNEAVWEKWVLDDAGRAELPMTESYHETWPMGMAIDFTSTANIPIGDNLSYPASPMLLLLATDGLLVIFHMMNSTPSIPSLQKPIEALTEQGARKGSGIITAPPQQVQPSTPQQKPVPAQSLAPQTSTARSLFQSPAVPTQESIALKQPQLVNPQVATGGGGDKPQLFGQLSTTQASKPSIFGGTNLPSSGAGFSFSLGNNTAATPGMGFSKPIAQSTPAPTATSQVANQNKPNLVPIPTESQATNAPNSFQTPASSIATNQIKPFQSPAASQATNQNTASIFQAPVANPNNSKQTSGHFALRVPDETTAPKVQVPSSSGFALPITSTPSTTDSLTMVKAGLKSGSASSPQLHQPTASAQQGTKVPPGYNFAAKQPATTAGGVQASIEPKSVNLHQSIDKAAQMARQGSFASKRTSDSTQPAPVATLQSTTVPSPLSNLTASTQPARPVATARRKSHEADDPFMKTILEEMEHFQKELDELKGRSSGSFPSVGTKEEMQEMHKNTEEMTAFCKEIKEQTHGINEEIHSLKSQCLESFATIEECRAREERNRDPSYRHLLGSRSLDPISERKQREIRTQFHYTENGIRDVDLKLDMEWEEYQRKKKRGTSLKTPASDAIYRTVTNNKRVIDTYTHNLTNLCAELKDLRLYNSTAWEARTGKKNSPALNGNVTIEDSLSNVRRGSSEYHPRTLGSIRRASNTFLKKNSAAETLLNASLSPQKAAGSSISPEKQAKLRDVLGNRRITPVKSTAPANLSMSKFVSSERLRELTETSFNEKDMGLEESYLDTKPKVTNMANIAMQSKPKSPIKTQVRSVSQPRSPISTTLGSPKPTAFTAVSKTSPQVSTQNDKKGGEKKSDGLFGGVKVNTGFAFGGSPAAPGQSFSFNAGRSVSPKPSPTMATTAKTIVTTTTSLATQKPVAMTTTVSSAMPKVTAMSGTPSFGFSGIAGGSTPFSFSSQTNKQTETPKTTAQATVPSSKQSAFSFTPTKPTTDSTQTKPQGFAFGMPTSSGDGKTDAGTGRKITKSSTSPAGFNFTTSGQPPTSGSGATAFKAEAPASSTGFNFGGAGTFPTTTFGGTTGGNIPTTTTFGGSDGDNNKTKTATVGPFSAFSGSGNKLGGTTDTTSADEGNTSQQQKQQTEATKAPNAQAKSDNFTMKSLLGESAFGQTGGLPTAVIPTAVDTDSEPQSLSTGDFTFGSALASVLIEEQESEDNNQAEQPQTTKPSETTSKAPDLTIGTETLSQPQQESQSSDTNSKPKLFVTVAPTTSSSESVKSTGLFGQASGSVFGGVRANSPPVSAGFQFGKVETSEKDKAEGNQETTSTPKFGVKVLPTVTAEQPAAIIEKSAPSGTEKVTVTTTQQQATSTSTPITSTSVPAATSASTATAVTSTTSATSALAGFSFVTADSTTGATTTPSGFSFGSTSTAVPSSTTNSGTTLFGQQPTAAATTTATAPQTITTLTPTQTANQPPAPLPTTSTVTAETGTTASTVASGTTSAATLADSTTAPVTTTPSIFGGSADPTTTSTQPFGSQSTTAQQLFGGTSATNSTGFGQTTGQAEGMFGAQPSATTATSGSSGMFGTQQPNSTATTGGLFRSQSSTTSSGGFGSGFAQPATFGSQATSTSGVGGFGATPTFGQTAFGQSATSTSGSGFGAAPAFGQQSTGFGQATTGGEGGMFGSSSSGGGGLFGGLGGKPSAEKANTNVFGTGFGGGTAAPQNQNLFGGQSSSAFNTVKTTGSSAFGSNSGGFSAAGAGSSFGTAGGVASTGFGGFGQQTPQKPAGFGGAPSFGGSPGFGSPPAFGGGAVFGSTGFGAGAGGMGSSTAGAGGSVFGSATPTQGQSGGFASFASADAPSFGNLAQTGGGTTFGAGGGTTFGAGGGTFGAAGGGVFGQPQQQQATNMFGGGNTGGGFGGSTGFGGAGTGGGFGQNPQNPAPTSPSFSAYRG